MNFKTEVLDLLKGIILTLLEMLNSKKFLASAGAAVAVYQQTADLRQAAVPIVVYVLAQTGVDWGKEAKKIEKLV